MDAEMQALQDSDTFTLTKLPQDKKTVGPGGGMGVQHQRKGW